MLILYFLLEILLMFFVLNTLIYINAYLLSACGWHLWFLSVLNSLTEGVLVEINEL